MKKSWWAGPRNATGFTMSGQSGPTLLKRAKNGLAQNGSGWPVLTTSLNQQPGGAAMRGDQSCHARRSELRREWPGLRCRNRSTFSSSNFSSSSIRVFELGFDLCFRLDFDLGHWGFGFGLKSESQQHVFVSFCLVLQTRLALELASPARVNEFTPSLKKNELYAMTCKLVRVYESTREFDNLVC